MIWVVAVVYFFLIVGAFVWALSTIIALIPAKGVPFVPLKKKQLEMLDKYIKLHANDKVVDLGSGDGRVLRLFEAQGVKDLSGYEINFWAHLISHFKKMWYHSKAKVHFKNFKQVDLNQYNIVFCYLLEGCLSSLREKFDKELKPGTKIVSYAFQIKDWHEPSEIIYTNPENKKVARIFIYTIK